MIKSYKYFTIPFANVPQNPSYTAWYALWTKDRPSAGWSKERPVAVLDPSTIWVVGLTADEPPPGATVLGTATKDPPQPPLALSPKITSMAAYQDQFRMWLDSRSA